MLPFSFIAPFWVRWGLSPGEIAGNHFEARYEARVHVWICVRR
jgi:hypothetical protein